MSPRPPIIADSAGLTVAHWKFTANSDASIPPENGKVKKLLWPWVSRFDHGLKLVSENDMRTNLPPEVATINGERPSIFPMSSRQPLLIRWADREGRETRRIEVKCPGHVNPLMTLNGSEGVLSVNNLRPSSVSGGNGRQQAWLLLMDPPPAK